MHVLIEIYISGLKSGVFGSVPELKLGLVNFGSGSDLTLILVPVPAPNPTFRQYWLRQKSLGPAGSVSGSETLVIDNNACRPESISHSISNV